MPSLLYFYFVLEGSSQGSRGVDRCPLCGLYWAGVGVSSNGSPQTTLLGSHAPVCLSLYLQYESKNVIKYPQSCGP